MTSETNVQITVINERGSITFITKRSIAVSMVEAILNQCERLSIPDNNAVTHVLSGTYLTNSYICVQEVTT